MTDIKQELAAEAVKIVTSTKRAAYGKPEDNFARIARMWNAHFSNIAPRDANGTQLAGGIHPRDVALLMILMKVARLAETPDYRDSVVDILGYALCYGEMVLPAVTATSRPTLRWQTASELAAEELAKKPCITEQDRLDRAQETMSPEAENALREYRAAYGKRHPA